MNDEKIPFYRVLNRRIPAIDRPVRSMSFVFEKRESFGSNEFNPFGGEDWGDAHEEPIDSDFNFRFRVMPNQSTQILKDYNFCIYCGSPNFTPAANEKCHDEHIIPKGIGGNIVVSRASCEKCAQLINSFEGNIQRNLFYDARRELKLKGRKRGTKPPLTVKAFVGESEVDLEIPIEFHPSLLMIPKFRPPAILEFRPDNSNFVNNIWMFIFDATNSFANEKLQNYMSVDLDFSKFAQLLAKIAYSYASTVYDLNSFTIERLPILRNSQMNAVRFIRRVFAKDELDMSCFGYIGSSPVIYEKSKYLHEIGHNIFEQNGMIFFIVFIRLFGILGAPVHYVILDHGI